MREILSVNADQKGILRVVEVIAMSKSSVVFDLASGCAIVVHI